MKTLSAQRNLKKLSRQAAFSMVDLMVVIAVIGILSAIVIPQFDRFRGRTRRAEAKSALSAAYQSMKSQYSLHNTYTSCLGSIGFQVDINTKRYYWVGIFDPNAVLNLCENGINCLVISESPLVSCDPVGEGRNYFSANSSANSSLPPVNGGMACGGSVSRNSFEVNACGLISSRTSSEDHWQINQDRKIQNIYSAF